ncbi:MAG: methyltransferase, partial [Bauldia sp.]
MPRRRRRPAGARRQTGAQRPCRPGRGHRPGARRRRPVLPSGLSPGRGGVWRRRD